VPDLASPSPVEPPSWVSHGLGRLTGRTRPHFAISVELADSPDFSCLLRIWNPGPEFVLRTCRLVAPRAGLIYRREQLLWGPNEGYGFSEVELDVRIAEASSAQVPFELWLPRTSGVRGLRVGVKTSRRFREYRCGVLGPTSDRPRASSDRPRASSDRPRAPKPHA